MLPHMAKLVKEVCDVCRNPNRKVKEYRVGRDGNRLLRVVLCHEDAKQIETLIAIGTPTSSNSSEGRLWTMDEIAAEKKRRGILNRTR